MPERQPTQRPTGEHRRQDDMPITTPCLGSNGRRCATLVPCGTGGRCHACSNGHTTTARGYGSQWQRHSKHAIASWRARHGDYCPGYRQGGHPAKDLVTDHDLGVMCRSCNGSKAATHDIERAIRQAASHTAR